MCLVDVLGLMVEPEFQSFPCKLEFVSMVIRHGRGVRDAGGGHYCIPLMQLQHLLSDSDSTSQPPEFGVFILVSTVILDNLYNYSVYPFDSTKNALVREVSRIVALKKDPVLVTFIHVVLQS
jgi:hypothetical protein